MQKGEASDLFGLEHSDGLASILGNIEQTFGGKALYPSVEERATALLYFVIKNHPFTDGNKHRQPAVRALSGQERLPIAA